MSDGSLVPAAERQLGRHGPAGRDRGHRGRPGAGRLLAVRVRAGRDGAAGVVHRARAGARAGGRARPERQHLGVLGRAAAPARSPSAATSTRCPAAARSTARSAWRRRCRPSPGSRRDGVAPSRPVAVVAFAEEEGSRFGIACLGSKLTTGAIDAGSALRLTDAAGMTFADAAAAAGVRSGRGRPRRRAAGRARRVRRTARGAGPRAGRPGRAGRGRVRHPRARPVAAAVHRGGQPRRRHADGGPPRSAGGRRGGHPRRPGHRGRPRRPASTAATPGRRSAGWSRCRAAPTSSRPGSTPGWTCAVTSTPRPGRCWPRSSRRPRRPPPPTAARSR